MSMMEFKRLCSEWRIRFQRIQQIVQPQTWSVDEWNRFCRSLVFVIQKYGNTWDQEGSTYWDIRWEVQGDAELVCQVEEVSDEKLSLVVAQCGGFVGKEDNYTWLYVEFGKTGDFLGEPYWVDGNWKDALAMVLLPQQMAAGFYLQSPSAALQTHLLPASHDFQPAETYRQAA